MPVVSDILKAPGWDREKILHLLNLDDESHIRELYALAREARNRAIGNKVYFRGLIEYSNRCAKNCYYCGIRAGNQNTVRYELSDDDVVEAALFAYQNKYASIVIQSGERNDISFTNHISELIKKIHVATSHSQRITLSCGEQTEEVYREWYELGAKRYLLRIEASNPELYSKLHPADTNHSYTKRLDSINTLIRLGYQAGTGVMIGVPFQTMEHLAEDLMFIYHSGVHMVGMGPYIEHMETPLYRYSASLLPAAKRVELSLKMIAILRLMKPNINIASTTALQALNATGREQGLLAGANVIMPNITPVGFKKNYDLYDGKPCLHDEPSHCFSCLENRIKMAKSEIAYSEWGDSKEYRR